MKNNSYDSWRTAMWEQHDIEEKKMLIYEKYWLEMECEAQEGIKKHGQEYLKDELAYLWEQRNQSSLYESAVKLWGKKCADKIQAAKIFKNF